MTQRFFITQNSINDSTHRYTLGNLFLRKLKLSAVHRCQKSRSERKSRELLLEQYFSYASKCPKISLSTILDRSAGCSVGLSSIVYISDGLMMSLHSKSILKNVLLSWIMHYYSLLFSFSRPSPMTVTHSTTYGCIKEIERYHSGSFLLIRENVVISLKTFLNIMLWFGFYMN